MSKRTYIDANVLIAAFRSDDATAARALAILDDADRRFVTSALVRLETLPKPRFHGYQDEVRFIEDFLAACDEHIVLDEAIATTAETLAGRHDLAPMDALHASAAIRAGVDEFVTLEKPEKPLCRIDGLTVISLYLSPNA
ncbi:MAG: type II toxin-antitoxin system VapC family toxin [Sulfuritalea sp.]|nr:type II toxin-antitoxin system VapC family toxin [Sulfuritalea sp.]MBK8118465.1 type II toxin-antitoxin system VapC family toxin [Sulfuritalea sp.]